MPSLINRVPPGLLSLLGIKAMGQNPVVLTDELRPTIELLDFYAGANAIRLNGSTGNLTGVGLFQISALQPPTGEIWLIHSCFFRTNAVLAAATTIRGRAVVHDVSLGVPVYADSGTLSGTTAEQPSMGWGRPVIIQPGYGVGVWLDAAVIGTAPTVRFDAMLLRLAL